MQTGYLVVIKKLSCGRETREMMVVEIMVPEEGSHGDWCVLGGDKHTGTHVSS